MGTARADGGRTASAPHGNKGCNFESGEGGRRVIVRSVRPSASSVRSDGTTWSGLDFSTPSALPSLPGSDDGARVRNAIAAPPPGAEAHRPSRPTTPRHSRILAGSSLGGDAVSLPGASGRGADAAASESVDDDTGVLGPGGSFTGPAAMPHASLMSLKSPRRRGVQPQPMRPPDSSAKLAMLRRGADITFADAAARTNLRHFPAQPVGVPDTVTNSSLAGPTPEARGPLPATWAQETGWAHAAALRTQIWASPGRPGHHCAKPPKTVTGFAQVYRDYALAHPFDAPPFGPRGFYA